MSDSIVFEANTATRTADTPQLLLEHHLKELRLPTILREYDKVARQYFKRQYWPDSRPTLSPDK